jgi:serine/threonine protein kinase
MTDTIDDLLTRNGLEILERQVASGGSSVIHKARVVNQNGRLPEVGSVVAVKEYHASLLAIPGQHDRVRQEADIGRRVQHPNLVQTFGLVESDSKTGPLALVLEWIDGMMLHVWYSSQPQPVPWDKLSRICVNLAQATAKLHENNVFHRDIKPENVMVRSDDTAVLMDVGVAEVAGNDAHTLHTAVKDFIGSTKYASRQFILGEPFTAADDVYSIGATVFLLFTGHEVYEEIVRKPTIPAAVLNGPPRIVGLAEGVPSSLRVLLSGCLNSEPSRRPSLQQFLEALGKPETADYISKELKNQQQESRSYEVIGVLDGGDMLLADLAGDTPREGGEHKVVRVEAPIQVPSYRREVAPEVMVGMVVLKHVHQNVGHFVNLRREWVESPRDPLFGIRSSGRWIEREATHHGFQKGDRVLKER